VCANDDTGQLLDRCRNQPTEQPAHRPTDTVHDRQRITMTMHDRDAAYDALSQPAAALYRQLGTCPLSWFDSEAIAVLTELDLPASARLAETLADAGLLSAVENGFALSARGHLHARIKAEQCDETERELNGAGLDRLLAFLNAAAAAAEQLITPSHTPLWEHGTPIPAVVEPPFPLDEAAALDWLELRLPVYMDAIRFAFADQRYAIASELVHRLWPLWLRRRHPAQQREALTIGLAAATVTLSDKAIGLMLTTLAGAVRGTDPVAGYGYNRRAAVHYEQIGDTKGLAQALDGIGKSLLHAGLLDEAEQHFRDAEQLRTGLGYVRGAALSRQGRGRVALARGDASAAADLLLSAYETLLGVGDIYDAGFTLIYHAEALAEHGDIPGAVASLSTAETAMRQATSVYGRAAIWETRARVLVLNGENDEAQMARAEAITLFDRVDPPSAQRLRDLPVLF
jgi:tetratricopeptide (TPR) repeat protein